MLIVPDDLTTFYPSDLYEFLDDLTEYRRQYGRGRTEDAAYAREYCKSERARVKSELRRRGLPLTRPGDTRTYGPGQAQWQTAGAAR